jgi:hypothetical protein
MTLLARPSATRAPTSRSRGVVAEGRQEDDRQRPVALGQEALQVETGHYRHALIHDDARRAHGLIPTQEGGRRRERLDLEAVLTQQSGDRRSHTLIVVHHVNSGRRRWGGLLRTQGRTTLVQLPLNIRTCYQVGRQQRLCPSWIAIPRISRTVVELRRPGRPARAQCWPDHGPKRRRYVLSLLSGQRMAPVPLPGRP